MYAENRTLAEATNYTTTNTLETPSLTDGTLVPVELHDFSCTNDIDVAGATPLIEIDTIPVSVPTESTLPAVVSSSSRTILNVESVVASSISSIEQKRDAILLDTEKKKNEKVTALVPLYHEMTVTMSSATAAANVVRYNQGKFLEECKEKLPHGCFRILQEGIAASSKYGDSVSSQNVSRDYFKIKNIMAYLDIPHYVMLEIYKVAEKAFGENDDPIAEFLKKCGVESIVDLGCASHKELLRLKRKFCAEQNANDQEGGKKTRKASTKTEQNHSQCQTESDAADDYDFSRCSFSRISKLITSLTNWAKDETKKVGNDWNEYKLRELNALKYALINLSKAVTNNLDVNHSTKAA